MTNHLDITVVISPGSDGAYAVRAVDSEGGDYSATLRLPFALRDLGGVVFGVDQTTRTVKARPRPEGGDGHAPDARSATEFGVELFEALFQGGIKTLLERTRGRASAQKAGVRVRLHMGLKDAGMLEAASLPWELMCEPGEQRGLALSTQTLLVRSIASLEPAEPRASLGPLRILLLISNPEGTTPLELADEKRRIEKSWSLLPGTIVDVIRPVQEDILRALVAHDYHVVHYMGHGDFDNSGGRLLLQDERGGPHPVSGAVFAGWLENEPARLVFLNACKTGTPGAQTGMHPFAGVASALVHKGVPAVVAMQYPISNDAATLFAATFYERIAQGYAVDAATTEGRKALETRTPAEWATPVVYLRSRDGHLFRQWVRGSAVASAGAPPPTQPAPTAPASAPPAESDPWGPGADGAFCVFLATPDENWKTRQQQLAEVLRKVGGVHVVNSVPGEPGARAATVEALVRRADLSVHLLGASPGKLLDDDDPSDSLNTVQLQELEIGLAADRPQFVVMTREGRDSIGNKAYKTKIDELDAMKRDRARFEVANIDKNRLNDIVVAKLNELRDARQAAAAARAPGSASGRTALVFAHPTDGNRALELVDYFADRRIKTHVSTTSSAKVSSDAEIRSLDAAVGKSSLCVVVAGQVESDWVMWRTTAVNRSAVKSGAPMLLGEYSAKPADGGVTVTADRLNIFPVNDGDRTWLDTLLASASAAAEDK